MLTKAKIKLIKSLQLKKYRKQEQLFVVEGAKSVRELIKSDFEVSMIVATPDFLDTIDPGVNCERFESSQAELESLGLFQSNETALAVARMKPNVPPSLGPAGFGLALDDIRDPGNLGTIIRTADWYGITSIVASEETADLYNSKVITSSMGSFTRVALYYTDLQSFFASNRHRVFGAFLEGTDVHQADFGDGGFIVIGNESRGISSALEDVVTDRITIPRYGHAESLNAAIATAVICDNLRRTR